MGGGPAGFFAAITCAEQGRGDPAPTTSVSDAVRILILEKTSHPLGKVLVSGGGRCNLTHACTDPAELVENYPRGKDVLWSAFARFQPADTITWFETRGVALKTEPDGRIFPVSNNSQSVVDCLLKATRQAGVIVWTGVGIDSINTIKNSPLSSSDQSEPTNQPRFLIRLKPGTSVPAEAYPETILSRCILFATGGDLSSINMAAAFGHTILLPVPSLFTFTIPDPRLEGLAGLSVPGVNLRLVNKETIDHLQNRSSEAVAPQITPILRTLRASGQASGQKQQRQRQILSTNLEQQGAVLITHWGLSGPAVLRLSAWGARWLHDRSYQAWLMINWMYPLHPAQVHATLQKFRDGNEQSDRANYSSQKVTACDPLQRLPQRLWQRLVQAAGIDGHKNWADLSNLVFQRLVEELTSGRFLIRGKGPFKEEFVTCGGVCLDEVNFKTMESQFTPGLFFAGEVLDIDGLTGGFNLQNAWTTGWIAGTAIAKALQG